MSASDQGGADASALGWRRGEVVAFLKKNTKDTTERGMREQAAQGVCPWGFGCEEEVSLGWSEPRHR